MPRTAFIQDEGRTRAAGVRLRTLREARQMSQPELASRAGTSQTRIKDFEAGKSLMSLPAVKALARALDVSPYLLIEPYLGEATDAAFSRLTQERSRLLGMQREVARIKAQRVSPHEGGTPPS